MVAKADGARTPTPVRAGRSRSRTATMRADSDQAVRVVGYARVSTDEQANGWGLPSQREQMERWCEANGAELVTIFLDVMTTRRVDRMVGREGAVAAVEAGIAPVLLVRALDRASRSMVDGIGLMLRAQDNGWRLLGVDGTDSADPDQELPNNARLMVAQEERRLISRRTKDGLERARAAGKQIGRVSTVPDSVAIRIGEEREAGSSFATIAANLDADNVPTPRGSALWRPAAVRDIYNRHKEMAS